MTSFCSVVGLVLQRKQGTCTTLESHLGKYIPKLRLAVRIATCVFRSCPSRFFDILVEDLQLSLFWQMVSV